MLKNVSDVEKSSSDGKLQVARKKHGNRR